MKTFEDLEFGTKYHALLDATTEMAIIHFGNGLGICVGKVYVGNNPKIYLYGSDTTYQVKKIIFPARGKTFKLSTDKSIIATKEEVTELMKKFQTVENLNDSSVNA